MRKVAPKNSLQELEQTISQMRLGRLAKRTKPHKPLMLLAVLDLFDANLVEGNRILFNQELVERFQAYFDAVKQEGDWCQPGPPFFHLRSSRFWKHQPIPGREEQYSRLSTSGGGSRRIVENIQYAYLDEPALAVFSSPDQRKELRRFILTTFFRFEEQQALQNVIEQEQEITAYESVLWQKQPPKIRDVQTFVRGAAFRRVVLRGYDYQCAVCGLRIVLPDISSPVDAAHLIPWRESQDDRPMNGMALCKLHHWALDANLISPTPALRWKVSRLLDDRRNSERELTRFDNMPILLPSDEALYPSLDSIQWRLERIAR